MVIWGFDLRVRQKIGVGTYSFYFRFSHFLEGKLFDWMHKLNESSSPFLSSLGFLRELVHSDIRVMSCSRVIAFFLYVLNTETCY